MTNGGASLVTPAFQTSGTQVLAAFYSGDANFLALGYPAVNLMVEAAAQPAIVITPGQASVLSGDSVTLTASLVNFAPGTAVTLACGKLPALVTCSFTSVTNNQAKLVVSTSTSSSASVQGHSTTLWAWMVPGLGFLLAGFAARRRRSLPRLLSMLALATACLSLAGCNSLTTTGHAGTGILPVTVTATAGGQTASTQFLLTIR